MTAPVMQTSTVAEAQDWLRSQADDGATCPVCTQHVQVYRRKINSSMAVSMVRMHKIAGQDWVNVTRDLGVRQAEESKLRWWGLVEEFPLKKRSGLWRLTDLGDRFVTERALVQSTAVVYNDVLLRLEGDLVSIRDVLGHRHQEVLS